MELAEKTWVTDIELFLTGIGVWIVLKKQGQHQLQKENDSFIIDYIFEDFDQSPSQQLNICRVLLDITAPDGIQLDRNILKEKSNEAFHSILKWPQQRYF